MRNQNRHNRGFTLIETLIYLALYAIIMTGAIVSAYAILSSSARNQTKALVQEEGSFLVGKIDWVLSGTQAINQPNDGVSSTVDQGSTLSITKFDASLGNPIVITLDGTNLTITRGTNPTEALNNSGIQISCPAAGCFKHTSASGDGVNPESLSAYFTLTTRTSDGISYSQDFSTTKYLRR